MPEFADLVWVPGSDNMGGTRGKFFYCPVDDIATWPTLDTDGVSLSGNYVCKTGKKFITIYATQGTGKIDSNLVGERDGRSNENFVGFNHPGGKKEKAIFKRKAQNTPCIVIAKDTDGDYRVVGTEELPAYLEVGTFTTGAASAEKRGTEFQWKSEANHEPLWYPGVIPLTPAE